MRAGTFVKQHATPLAAAILGVLTVAVGLYEDANGRLLGVPHPPFIGGYNPEATGWLALAIPCFAVAVALVNPLLAKPKALAFAAAIFATTLVLRIVLFAARLGGDFDRTLTVLPRGEGKNEYLPTMAAFEYGPRFVLDRFAELVPALPVHSAGHPPGLILTMHYLGLTTGMRLAWFCLIVGALATPLTYVLAKQLFDERTARIAGVLMVFAPVVLHFGAVSPDAVYLTLGLLAAIPLASGRLVLGGIALAVVVMFAWSELAVGAWAAILVLTRDGFRPALKLGVVCGIAVLGVQALLALTTGWDPIGTFHATHEVYDVGIASRRPYWYWLFGSPTAFFLILGPAISWLAFTRLQQRAPEAFAIFAVILVATVAGFTKAETERIWLFLVPFVCLAAAPLVRRPTLIAATLAVQAIVYELLFDTLW
ncbi:hypothetical protein DVA67_004620 [Solirubrobacter sp. CPCC 204708]|uniref:Glycosyltransferase RgtA/B/C/D-like domain-containing protein n=1 Tax=Solirubrobacter deserti TaxID=2282478 RepID=A0ABT4RH95_9ACTN|nr:hypothetical protein [Solirubrobacter deserti]MBE2315245.1 hypothetical protein [Solirubrobacter deserti]MDA0137929.1 hypothetical protein [Solirubrobacter deserti]